MFVGNIVLTKIITWMSHKLQIQFVLSPKLQDWVGGPSTPSNFIIGTLVHTHSVLQHSGIARCEQAIRTGYVLKGISIS